VAFDLEHGNEMVVDVFGALAFQWRKQLIDKTSS